MLLLVAASTSPSYMLAESVVSRPAIGITQQNGEVVGVVKDNLGPVVGASVVVKGTTNGIMTDVDGKFALSGVKKGDIIQVSFVGYVTQNIKYTGQNSITVSLKEDSQALEEVVVTGFAGSQKTKTLTAAAVNVKMESIAKLPVVSAGDGLGGRVSGIITQARSGAPGEVSKIWIRGGSQILYVIDDVVMETAQGEVYFNRLRPDDIASMTILKDASATAVYGPRAYDGVVVVTTKKGMDGALDISFSQKVSIMQPSYRPKPVETWEYWNQQNELHQYSMMEVPQYSGLGMHRMYMGHLYSQGMNRQQITDEVNRYFGEDYTLSEVNDLFDPMKTQGNDITNYYVFHDPWTFFDHTQPMSQTNLSVRGGSERLRYYTSLGYMKQKGIAKNYDYDQYNAVVNTDSYLLNDKSLKFTLNFNGIMSTKRNPFDQDAIFSDAMFYHSHTVPRNWTTGKTRAGGPDARLQRGWRRWHDYRLQTSIGLKWSLPWVKGLSVGASVNFNYSNNMTKQFNHPEIETYGWPGATATQPYNPNSARLWQDWSNYSLTTGLVQADYNRKFGKHNVSAMINYTSQVRNTNSTGANAYGFPTIYAPQINMAANRTSCSGGEGQWGSASVVGRVTYDYDNKYMIQASANYNGSLCYHPDKRWGFFYAVSGGWSLTEEDFIKDLIGTDYINLFKIRAGYGVVGKELSAPFSYMNYYGLGGNILFGDKMGANSIWREANVSSNLTWGESQQISGGVDIALFNNRLKGSFDTYLYLNKGDEINMNPEIVYTPILGLPNTPKMNAPYVTSHKGGVEFSLNWSDRIGKDFSYKIGGNFTHWKTAVVRHSQESEDWYFPNFNDLGKNAWHQPTYTVSWKNDGLYKDWDDLYNSYMHMNRSFAPGTIKHKDINGDGVLNVGDQVIETRGGQTPQTLYGITLGAGWKDLSFEVFFQGAAGVFGETPSVLRSQQYFMMQYGRYFNKNSYRPSNPIMNQLPVSTKDGYGWGYNYCDYWVYDNSYLKLKNISLSYNLKPNVLKNVDFIHGLQVNFIVNNVCTWVKKTNFMHGFTDPEFMPEQSIWGNARRLGSYPTQRSFTLSATLTL